MNIHTPLHTQNKKKENITQRWMISTFFSSSLSEWRLQTRSWQEGEHEIFTASCWDQWIQNDFSPKAMSEWNEWSPTHTQTLLGEGGWCWSPCLSLTTPPRRVCVCACSGSKARGSVHIAKGNRVRAVQAELVTLRSKAFAQHEDKNVKNVSALISMKSYLSAVCCKGSAKKAQHCR